MGRGPGLGLDGEPLEERVPVLPLHGYFQVPGLLRVGFLQEPPRHPAQPSPRLLSFTRSTPFEFVCTSSALTTSRTGTVPTRAELVSGPSRTTAPCLPVTR